MKFGVEHEGGLVVTTGSLGNGGLPFKLFHECGDCEFSEIPSYSKNPDRLFCKNSDCFVEDTHRNWTPAQAHEALLRKSQGEVTCKHEELGVSCYSPRQQIVTFNREVSAPESV